MVHSSAVRSAVIASKRPRQLAQDALDQEHAFGEILGAMSNGSWARMLIKHPGVSLIGRLTLAVAIGPGAGRIEDLAYVSSTRSFVHEHSKP